jgi:hypothetical protein
MRTAAVTAALLALFCLGAGPLGAAEWGRHVNARYGYETAVPPGFTARGAADNGDGQIFATATAELRVFGGNILEGDFEAEMRWRQGVLEAEGWALTDRMSTPDAAVFAAQRAGRLLSVRAMALCGGDQFGMLMFTYLRADIAASAPLIDRLAAAFRPTGDGLACR